MKSLLSILDRALRSDRLGFLVAGALIGGGISEARAGRWDGFAVGVAAGLTLVVLSAYWHRWRRALAFLEVADEVGAMGSIGRGIGGVQ